MDLHFTSHAPTTTHPEPTSQTAALVTAVFTHQVLNVIATSRLHSVALEVAAGIHCAEVFSAKPSGTSVTVRFDSREADGSGANAVERLNVLTKEYLTELHGLKRDACQLQSFQIPQPDVNDLDEHTRFHISASQKDACLHWAHHLSHTSPDDEEAYRLLRTFLTQKLLLWLEFLSLLGKVDMAASLLEIAASWLNAREARLQTHEHELEALLRDCARFIEAFKEPIAARACHVYSALVFCKTDSTLHRFYDVSVAKGPGHLPGATMLWTKHLVRFLGMHVVDLSELLRNTAGTPGDSTCGGYSVVYSMRLQPNGPVVAIKALRAMRIDDNSPVGLNRFCKRLLREVKLGSSLQHPHVLQVSGFAIIAGQASLVTPWCKFGNIRKYLQQTLPNYDRRLALLLQAAQGLKYLHLHDPVVAHGDLKADNVLVSDDKQAQLCDYGLSRYFEDSQLSAFFTSTIGKGTARWCAPELLEEDTARCSPKTDIYSFASLGLEIMTDQVPFVNIRNDFKVMKAIERGQTPLPEWYPQLPAGNELWNLFRRCWCLAPEERPTISTVCDELARLIRR